MRDSSLEDFLGDGDSDADGNTETETEARASADDADTVSPAVPTYEWTPTGAACPRCGAVVERRWRDDTDDDAGGELVCPDCKVW